MATPPLQVDLTPLVGIFTSISNTLTSQSTILQNLYDKTVESSEDLQRAMAFNSISNQARPAAGTSAAGQAGQSFGREAGAGLGQAAGRVGGIAALGLALPAFFGGLMAGDATLGWLSTFGSGFDFTNLQAATVGFSNIVENISPAGMTALAGIMAISTIGGTNSAKGLGAMGFAISAFLGGLLAGDALFAGYSALGGGFEFGSLKAVLEGFSSAIDGLTDTASIKLAGILGLGAISSLVSKNPLDMAMSMAGLSAGIIGFLGGLVIGNDIISFAEIMGADLDLTALKDVLTGFSGAIGSLDDKGAIALAGILGAAGGLAAFGKDKTVALNTAAIMTGMGAGISGFMIGITAGDKALSWLDSKFPSGGGLKNAFKMFNDSVGELNNENAINALAAILGVGTVIGTITGGAGPAAAAGIAAIMTGIGAGISGLFIGLAAGGKIVDVINSIPVGGDGFVSVIKMFNDSILAISTDAIDRLTMISNAKFGDGLVDLGKGIAAFFAAEALGGITESFSEIKDAMYWLFTFGDERTDKSAIQQVLDGLKPLENLDFKLIGNMNVLSDALVNLSNSFSALANIKVEKTTESLGSMLRGIGSILDAKDALINGGTWDGQSWGYGDNINFGAGLKNLTEGDIETISKGVNDLYTAMGVKQRIEPRAETGGVPETEATNPNAALEALVAQAVVATTRAAAAAASAANSAAAVARSGGSGGSTVINNTSINADPAKTLSAYDQFTYSGAR